MDRVFIIAEAGVNHNGDVELAKRMVNAARESGADSVKFQTFRAEKTVSKFAPKAAYQKDTTDTGEAQLDMLKSLELNRATHKYLISYCGVKGILFLSSPFDLESIDLLDELGLEMLKIPSGEITNLPYLRKIGGLKKKIIMSTGMTNLEEIKCALNVLTISGTPKENITILHCNTGYPTPFEDVNLKAMLLIKDTFGVKVGYSDHTLGIEAPIAAVALGASIIEKHFTLDRAMEGPDHKASLEPQELKAMIKAIRNVENALGDGIKRVSPSELENKRVARKSAVAAREIKKGELFSEENITFKRPGVGISPMDWYKMMGKTAKRDFKEDEVIEL
ncbi:MAG: N-acetylneuraminate synthase [Candidatus Omnitrophota bacterium]|nr:MAG: N-acetylneuraminate synthase [Candidatus Omnitrophota bacterium]